MKGNTEQRWSIRRAVAMDVMLYDSRGMVIEGQIQNVSIGGVYVDTGSTVPQLNSSVILGFQMKSLEGTTYHRLPALVVHVENMGAGLMFEDYDDNTIAALRTVVQQSVQDQFGTA